jgi:glycerol-3-phosphate acyltransferase PlsX
MGGDHAPTEAVAGALKATADGYDVVLVGDAPVLQSELDAQGGSLPIVHAREVIDMGEDPGRAVREKPENSIAVAARLVKSGEARALVSAGSTGAVLAVAATVLRRLPGVLRPAIASIFPTLRSPTVVLDCGANPECKPEHLVQFAHMGSLVASTYLGLDAPRVGLVNIGEEAGKGRSLDREAYSLLAASDLNFVGNVEGRDLATDRADVFVTDGFTGNVLLKTTEGAVQLTTQLATEALAGAPTRAVAGVLPAMETVRQRLDHEAQGGAHLLGTAGVVVVAHGQSSRHAIASAIEIAADGADRRLAEQVAERLGNAVV